jgi:hypothetical protein
MATNDSDTAVLFELAYNSLCGPAKLLPRGRQLRQRFFYKLSNHTFQRVTELLPAQRACF